MKRTFALLLAVIFLLTACSENETTVGRDAPGTPSENEPAVGDNTLPPSASPTPPSERGAIPESTPLEPTPEHETERVISPDETKQAYIYPTGYKVIGTAYIHDMLTGQATALEFDENVTSVEWRDNPDTPFQVMWLDDDYLLLLMGNALGVYLQDANIYYYRLSDGVHGRIIESGDYESFTSIKTDETGGMLIAGVTATANRDLPGDFFDTTARFSLSYIRELIENNETVVREPSPPSSEIEYNNDAANIIKGGWSGTYAVTDGEWIYYSIYEFKSPVEASEGFLYRKRNDGTGEELIHSAVGWMRNLNIVGDWIYFIVTWYSEGRPGGIYKVRTDGTEEVLVYDAGRLIEPMYVAGEWIYYTDRSDSARNMGIYKIRLDGTDNTLLTNSPHGSVLLINIIGDWIYYRCTWDGTHYKVRTDGTENQEFVNTPKLSLNIVDGWSYFANEDDNHSLSKINMYTGEIIKLNDEVSSHISVIGDWVYYVTAFVNEYWTWSFWKIRTDGTEKTLIADNMFGEETPSFVSSVIVVGDWIYYEMDVNRGGTDPMYRIKTDGTQFQQILD
ncbi:MAG: DUF5050 domain-containing protein [Oscillospiraceae bacterium]|nr:DUF5050 domain-containing protein [Oscillospiraceae bacterium]